jgi:uncharacterized membrane protein
VHEMVSKKESQGLDMAKVWNNDSSIIDQVEEVFKGFSDEQFVHLMQMFPVCTQLPDNRKEVNRVVLCLKTTLFIESQIKLCKSFSR